MESKMGSIINFQRGQFELLRGAAEAAEAQANRRKAEVSWLQENGAKLADLVRATLWFDEALHKFQQHKAELDRMPSATIDKLNHDRGEVLVRAIN
jgi:hypothetical protein